MSTETQLLSILDWCNKMHEQGHEICLNWDGGGDSGWVYFTIDGETTENEYTTALVEYMYDHLDYGSWAGEFSANGQAKYDPNEKAFIGTDYYSEDGSTTRSCDITFKVPKSLWFDTLNVQVQGEEAIASVEFEVKNGFLSKEHEQFAQTLGHDLTDLFDKEVEFFQPDNDNQEYRSVWDQYEFTPADDKSTDPDNYLFKIDKISFSVSDTDDKDICLSVESFTEPVKARTDD